MPDRGGGGRVCVGRHRQHLIAYFPNLSVPQRRPVGCSIAETASLIGTPREVNVMTILPPTLVLVAALALGACAGPAGPPGPQGNTGYTGATGDQGQRGQMGPGGTVFVVPPPQ